MGHIHAARHCTSSGEGLHSKCSKILDYRTEFYTGTEALVEAVAAMSSGLLKDAAERDLECPTTAIDEHARTFQCLRGRSMLRYSKQLLHPQNMKTTRS